MWLIETEAFAQVNSCTDQNTIHALSFQDAHLYQRNRRRTYKTVSWMQLKKKSGFGRIHVLFFTARALILRRDPNHCRVVGSLITLHCLKTTCFQSVSLRFDKY